MAGKVSLGTCLALGTVYLRNTGEMALGVESESLGDLPLEWTVTGRRSLKAEPDGPSVATLDNLRAGET